jgi:hypothetical protein
MEQQIAVDSSTRFQSGTRTGLQTRMASFAAGKGLNIAATVLLGLALSMSATAATIDVVPWLAPNATSGSPSFPGAQENAVQAMYNNVTTFGTAGTPTYFQAQSDVTTASSLVTGFNSWLGQTDPGTVFGPAFANEYGNRLTFALRVDGQGSQFSVSQLSFSAVSTDAGHLLSFGYGVGEYDYTSGLRGVLKGSDGILWTNDDIIITSGPNTQLVDGLVGRGSGNSNESYCTGCSFSDQQAMLNSNASYAGSNFTFTGTYAIGSDTGSGTFNIAAVPEPETYAMLLAGLGLLGYVRRRRQQKEALAA